MAEQAVASPSIGSRVRAVRRFCWRDCVWGDRFVLVTCEPDAVVGRVHSRMPLSLTAPEALAWLDRSTTARDLLARHAPVPLEAQEEPAPTRRPSDSDQMSLF